MLEYLIEDFLGLLGRQLDGGDFVVTRILAFLVPTIPKIPEEPFEMISISSFRAEASVACRRANGILNRFFLEFQEWTCSPPSFTGTDK